MKKNRKRFVFATWMITREICKKGGSMKFHGRKALYFKIKQVKWGEDLIMIWSSRTISDCFTFNCPLPQHSNWGALAMACTSNENCHSAFTSTPKILFMVAKIKKSFRFFVLKQTSER